MKTAWLPRRGRWGSLSLPTALGTAPLSLRQDTGTWTYPLWQLMPVGSGSETYAITEGGSFATVDAAGVVSIDTTSGRSGALLTVRMTDGADTHDRCFAVTVAPLVADHTVSDQAGFDALTLAPGDVVELNARINGALVVNGISDLTITSASETASVEGIEFQGTCDNITLKNFSIECRTWPHTRDAITFNAVTSVDGFTIDGCRIVGLYDGTDFWDTGADLPIYDVHRFTGTAGSASTTSITWDAIADAGVTTAAYCYITSPGGVQFEFLDASDAQLATTTVTDVYTSGTPEYLQAAGERAAKVRITATSGTPTYVMRVFQDVTDYMPDMIRAVTNSVAADVFTIRNSFTSGFNNTLKPGGNGFGGNVLVKENILLATRQDVLATQTVNGATYRVNGNLIQQGFALRLTLGPDDLVSDPGDPHGDNLQLFSSTPGEVVSLVEVIGNSMLPIRLREVDGRAGQSDIFPQHKSGNSNNPAYDRIIVVGNYLGSGGGGVDGAYADEVVVVGNVSYGIDPTDTASGITARGYTEDDATAIALMAKNVGMAITSGTAGQAVETQNYEPADNTDWANAFSGWSDVRDAGDKASADAVFAPVGAAAGTGPAAATWYDSSYAVNWSAIPAATSFADQVDIEVSATATSEIKRLIVGDATKTVTPGSGVEWRWATTEGGVAAANWSSTAGDVTASGGISVWVQMRFTASAVENTQTSNSIVVDGVVSTMQVTTAAALTAPVAHKAIGNTGALSGPSIGAGNTGMTMVFDGQILTQAGSGVYNLFGLPTGGTMRLQTRADASFQLFQLRMEDGIGGVVFSAAQSNSNSFTRDDTMRVVFSCTLNDGTSTARAKIWVNGSLVMDASAASTGNDTFINLPPSLFHTDSAAGAAVSVGAVQIFLDYTDDGSIPAGTPWVDLTGNLAYWNGTGLPSGWSKAGDAFTTPP